MSRAAAPSATVVGVTTRDARTDDLRRDRDESGRPRQARPRDELGRPLPYGAVGVPPVSEEPRSPEGTVAAARELLAAGRPFAAHETYEVAWKHRPDAERALWQGMAQLCVAITHAARGNATGAARLLERASARLTAYSDIGGPTYGLDLVAELAAAERLVRADATGGRDGAGS